MKPKQKKVPKYLDPGTVIIIKQVFLGILVFSTIAALITIVWYSTRIKSLTIDTVTVSGGVTINEELVRNKVDEQLEGAYLKLVPKRFAFFYPEEIIYASVKSIERIKNVSVEKKSNKEIIVSFDEYMPDNLWCSYGTTDDCYFIDKEGYAFTRSPSLTGGSLVRYYLTSTKAEVGQSPFTSEDYKNTEDFIAKLADKGWFVNRVEIDAVRDVFYTMARGSELKASLTEAAEKPLSNLETIIQSKEFSHLEPGNFQYVDLRFGTRVFVNEELLVSVDEKATSTEAVAADVDIDTAPEVLEVEPEVAQ
jgi:cell division septal protein FtsQ